VWDIPAIVQIKKIKASPPLKWFFSFVKYLVYINMKNLIVIFLLLLPNLVFGQIKVLDVGDGWKNKVELALQVIKKYDPEKYNKLITYCDEIGFWGGSFSTTEGNKIILSRTELNNKSINNIACALVHESRHIMLEKSGTTWDENFQEFMCYDYELNFALKIPNIENWLLDHIRIMRNKYAKIISS
jgi:hypothetical protein